MQILPNAKNLLKKNENVWAMVMTVLMMEKAKMILQDLQVHNIVALIGLDIRSLPFHIQTLTAIPHMNQGGIVHVLLVEHEDFMEIISYIAIQSQIQTAISQCLELHHLLLYLMRTHVNFKVIDLI